MEVLSDEMKDHKRETRKGKLERKMKCGEEKNMSKQGDVGTFIMPN